MRMPSGERGDCGGDPIVGVDDRSGLQAAAAASEMETKSGRSSSRGGDAATAWIGDRCHCASQAAGRGEFLRRAEEEEQEKNELCAGGVVVHAVVLRVGAARASAGAAAVGERKWKSGDVERTGAASRGG